jgi:hypothetical protein
MAANNPRSRYSRVQQALFTRADGRAVPYLMRRFLPQPSTLPIAGSITVGPADRLDLIATKALGDPLQAWRIADANTAMNPFDLVVPPGRALRVPQPQP